MDCISINKVLFMLPVADGRFLWLVTIASVAYFLVVGQVEL